MYPNQPSRRLRTLSHRKPHPPPPISMLAMPHFCPGAGIIHRVVVPSPFSLLHPFLPPLRLPSSSFRLMFSACAGSLPSPWPAPLLRHPFAAQIALKRTLWVLELGIDGKSPSVQGSFGWLDSRCSRRFFFRNISVHEYFCLVWNMCPPKTFTLQVKKASCSSSPPSSGGRFVVITYGDPSTRAHLFCRKKLNWKVWEGLARPTSAEPRQHR